MAKVRLPQDKPHNYELRGGAYDGTIFTTTASGPEKPPVAIIIQDAPHDSPHGSFVFRYELKHEPIHEDRWQHFYECVDRLPVDFG